MFAEPPNPAQNTKSRVMAGGIGGFPWLGKEAAVLGILDKHLEGNQCNMQLGSFIQIGLVSPATR